MGRLCRLWRVEDGPELAVYAYGDNRDKAGRIRISKVDGAIERLECVPGLSDQDDWFIYSMLAKARLEKCFKTGEYPAETHLAT